MKQKLLFLCRSEIEHCNCLRKVLISILCSLLSLIFAHSFVLLLQTPTLLKATVKASCQKMPFSHPHLSPATSEAFIFNSLSQRGFLLLRFDHNKR